MMFDSGFLEIFVIALIGLIVIGPERLPAVASKLGKFTAKVKAFVSTTKADIEREFQAEELKTLIEQQKSEISELRDMVSENITDNIVEPLADAKESASEEFNTIRDEFSNLSESHPETSSNISKK